MRRCERPARSVQDSRYPLRVEHRVERARADAVAMPSQFLDHPLSVQVALGGMVQDVEPNESGEELLMFHLLKSSKPAPIIESRFREPMI